MTSFCCALLAAVSVLDYPALQPQHEAYKAQMLQSIRSSDALGMRMVCLKAVDLFPEDPVWNYNLACAYAKGGKFDSALKSLEKAIRCGYRDSRAISNDADFKSMSDMKEFHDLLDLADKLRDAPMTSGPLAALSAKESSPDSVIIGERNLVWDFNKACFFPFYLCG